MQVQANEANPGRAEPSTVVFTRTRGTSVAFSWRVRLVLSVLPAVPIVVFMWGGLGFGPLTWLFGLITVIATVLWLPHVWTSAPMAAPRPVGQGTSSSTPQLATTSETALPEDHFAWITPVDAAHGDLS